ncbi:MAG: SUMF1/EgtB/PvdO family nonheme iron enzyme [Anaerolineales bacterium]|jgi:formylglycine-generating enzyme required for sulfatase activity
MNRFVFAIGSTGGKPLSATKKDAASFWTLLISELVGKCHKDSPEPLIGCKTIDEFNYEFNKLLRKWDPKDQLVFYYSGHGKKLGDRYCLVLGNDSVDLLPFNSLIERLTLSGVENSIFVLDACASGQAIKTDNDDPAEDVTSIDPNVKQDDIPPGMAILASSGPAQFSWENSQGDASIFTEALVSILTDGLNNGKEYLFVDDVVEAIAKILKSEPKYLDYKQDPVFSLRGQRNIWIAHNIAYLRGVIPRPVPIQNNVYSPTDLELLAFEIVKEELPSDPGSLEHLDWNLITDYWNSLRDSEAEKLVGVPSVEETLEELNLFSAIPVQGQRVLHRSAVFCFCRDPDLFHPESITIYVDKTRGEKFFRSEIKGPISRQLEDIRNRIEGFDTFSFVDSQGVRQDRAQINLDLFREVLTNALVHRDFNVNGNVEVRILDNCVEVSNPGSLLQGKDFATVLDMTRRSVPKNPLLLLYMNRFRRTEQIGRGFELIREHRSKYGPDSVTCAELLGPVTVVKLYHIQKFPKDFIKVLSIRERGVHLGKLNDNYRRFLIDSHNNMDFKGARLLEAIEKDIILALEDIFVPLLARPEMPEGETWQRIAGRLTKGEEKIPKEAHLGNEISRAEPEGMDEIINRHPALVVLGDPGSGKSTLLKALTISFAKREDGPLPILIPLSAYAKYLEKETVHSLREYLPIYFSERQGNLRGLEPLFEEAISSGKAIILLDGLDEIHQQRGYLVELINDFAREVAPKANEYGNSLHGNRVIVTSRFVGYRKAPLDKTIFTAYALVDWERPEIERFVSLWVPAVERAIAGGTWNREIEDKSKQEAADLMSAISSNEDIERLAGNPLLMTILALIKRQNVTLPNRRVELYEAYIRILLSEWNKARNLDKDPIGPDIDYHELSRILSLVSLWVRETSPLAGLVSESQLRAYLADYFEHEEGFRKKESREGAKGFLDAIHKYSNLLVERSKGQFGFIHLTFEEYLAGKGLVQLEREVTIEKIKKYLLDPGWHETICLGIEALGIVMQQPIQAGPLVTTLLEIELSDEMHSAFVLQAGEVLADVGEIGLGRVAANNITENLVSSLQSQNEAAENRRKAGLLLGRAGWVPVDLDAFVIIEPGKFLYGGAGEEREIDYPYWIAKYPVTNLQYARFIDSKGYEQKDLWSDAGWTWRKGSNLDLSHLDNEMRGLYENWLSKRPLEKRHLPFWWDDIRWNNPLFPVVGVSWYEAEAYSNWLNQQELNISKPLGYAVRLATEEEWERAARGSEGREYPWGDEYDPNNANVGLDFDSREGTTAVMTFPQGVSPEGVWDMSGNVWEWTQSWWYQKEKRFRVLRGGSWLGDLGNARCGARDRDLPDYFVNAFGFRVVISPFSEL